MKESAVTILASYIDALHPIIYINHFDSKVIDDAIMQVMQSAKCLEFNNALGAVDFKTKRAEHACDLEQFLKIVMDYGFDHNTFIILRDIHGELKNPKIIALLKMIAEKNRLNLKFCGIWGCAHSWYG